MMRSVLRKLEKRIDVNNYSGWDPYDGLNSMLLRTLTLDRKWLRIAAIQAMKRSPVNLRALLRVPKARNPKAIGLLADAYLLRYKQTREESFLSDAHHLLDWLIENSSPGYGGFAWGHNFDWQSAVFYIPRGVPTVVNTAFIANAFLDAYEITGYTDYLNVARSSCDYILNDLNRLSRNVCKNSQFAIRNSKCFCFSYSPVDRNCCHNANLLAGELLARVYSLTGDKILHDTATKSVEFTISMQNPDGSWFYGLSPRQRFIDSFHTGFILVSLKNVVDYLEMAAKGEFRRMVLRGYDYYKRKFWENNGCPRYYHDRKYPIDLHCSAQGIITFLRFREYDNEAVDTARKIAKWAIDNMWDAKKGYFYFQKTKYFTNKIPYLRWPNAWMFYALSLLDSIV